MAITEEQKLRVREQMMEWLAVDDDEAEALIDRDLEDWSPEERAYWHYIVDNYEPDEFVEAVEKRII